MRAIERDYPFGGVDNMVFVRQGFDYFFLEGQASYSKVQRRFIERYTRLHRRLKGLGIGTAWHQCLNLEFVAHYLAEYLALWLDTDSQHI
jgi:hypothetical protein